MLGRLYTRQQGQRKAVEIQWTAREDDSNSHRQGHSVVEPSRQPPNSLIPITGIPYTALCYRKNVEPFGSVFLVAAESLTRDISISRLLASHLMALHLQHVAVLVLGALAAGACTTVPDGHVWGSECHLTLHTVRHSA